MKAKRSVDDGVAPTRVALIGCGKMGLQHLKALRLVPGVVIVGVADPAADRKAINDAAACEVPVYGNASEMLEAASPQVVHVVSPPSTHTPLALQALRAGCHVYVEKPFATTLADARAMLAEAAARKLKVCAGHQCLFELPAIRAIEGIAAIGTVVNVVSRFSFRKVRRTLTFVEQCKDILPHAIYPMLQQLRHGRPARAPIEIAGCVARASGDLFALLKVGDATGIVEVTLSGRPVEQYQDIVGTNGALRADYVTGSVIRLIGPGTGVGTLLMPFRRGFQTLGAANRLFWRALTGRAGSYGGLHGLMRSFYASIRLAADPPMSPDEILDTVEVCERLGQALDAAESQVESAALAELDAQSRRLDPPVHRRVLVTGGTGFLGLHVTEELRRAGFPVTVIARREPPASRRVAGVDYAIADLANGLDIGSLGGVEAIVHCAAETAGGLSEHERNSVNAARRLLASAAAAGVRRIVHVSSLAVLKPSYRRRRPVDESTPIDPRSLDRGPYAWGKAESELEMRRLASTSAIELRVIRPGPIVDYEDFQPPGRLGRELGSVFLAIGGRRSRLPVCDVRTVARVVRSYLEDFGSAPPVLNLLDEPLPTRTELMARHLARRTDLRVWWLPATVLRLMNAPAKLAQRLLLGAKQPVDLYAAFAGGNYSTELAATVIARANAGSVRRN